MTFLDTLPTAKHGTYLARTLADSVALNSEGARLTTFELTFPRFILSEFNTHRLISKNSSSSRAIPVSVQLRKILQDPFVPEEFGINEPGMQASAFLTGAAKEQARKLWLRSRSRAVLSALELLLGEEGVVRALGSDYLTKADFFDSESAVLQALNALDTFAKDLSLARKEGRAQDKYLNVHKQTANRLLEPFAWHTVLATGTEWSNFLALRDSEMAQPEIRTVAQLMRQVSALSTPDVLAAGEAHLPLLAPEERTLAAQDPSFWREVVAGRCARVSYETHDGRRDVEADRTLAFRLLEEGHMSPFEHIGFAQSTPAWSGNFYGFDQYRKSLPFEHDFGLVLANR